MRSRGVAHAARVLQAFLDPAKRVVLVSLDRLLEQRLHQYVQHAGAKQSDKDPEAGFGTPERRTRPQEVDDDAQVRQLEGEPHIAPAGQPLKPAARAARPDSR
jgi:hypothetical protein